jgi:undecaprenyl diphosphate synthase
MDGNGRWAQRRFMPRPAGHAVGASRVGKLVEHSAKRGVKYLTLFAFSTENWQRPSDEVSSLMGLFAQYLGKGVQDLADAGVRLKVIGDLGGFSQDLQRRIRQAELATEKNKLITLTVAANYGGRWDVVQAVKVWQQSNPSKSIQDLTEAELAGCLSTAGVPEVDLVIRTGGEQRVSNFLLWQSAYAELYFTDILWPDFDEAALDQALDWYCQRARRFGKTAEQAAVE